MNIYKLIIAFLIGFALYLLVNRVFKVEGVTNTQLCNTGECAVKGQQCYYEQKCDPNDKNFNGGKGCNAGGIDQNCRFCGFGGYSGIACDGPAAPENCEKKHIIRVEPGKMGEYTFCKEYTVPESYKSPSTWQDGICPRNTFDINSGTQKDMPDSFGCTSSNHLCCKQKTLGLLSPPSAPENCEKKHISYSIGEDSFCNEYIVPKSYESPSAWQDKLCPRETFDKYSGREQDIDDCTSSDPWCCKKKL